MVLGCATPDTIEIKNNFTATVMMRVIQSLPPPGAIGSEHCNDPRGRRYAALVGIVHDLKAVQVCLDRIAELNRAGVPATDTALAAFTWHAVLRYARCFDDGAEGRQGRLGAHALRLLSNDEATLHEGLLAVRDGRFAHAGQEANHRCLVILVGAGGGNTLIPGYEIETPTGMFDQEQVELMSGMVRTLIRHAEAECDTALRAFEQWLAEPAVGDPIRERLLQERRFATPEGQALALLRALQNQNG